MLTEGTPTRCTLPLTQPGRGRSHHGQILSELTSHRHRYDERVAGSLADA